MTSPLCDCLIVFGASVRADGSASPALRRRAEAGARLVLGGVAPMMIVSGGAPSGGPSEASLMAKIAMELGVGREQIVLEDRSANSAENILNSTEIVEAREFVTLGFVSDFYHLPRLYLTARLLGLWPKVFAARMEWRMGLLPKLALAIVREIVAIPVYLWRFRKGRP